MAQTSTDLPLNFKGRFLHVRVGDLGAKMYKVIGYLNRLSAKKRIIRTVNHVEMR